jgi:hypothetical protein
MKNPKLLAGRDSQLAAMAAMAMDVSGIALLDLLNVGLWNISRVQLWILYYYAIQHS